MMKVNFAADKLRLRGYAAIGAPAGGITSAKTPTYHARRHPMSRLHDFGGPFDPVDRRSRAAPPRGVATLVGS
jgi:hypothetical protein